CVVSSDARFQVIAPVGKVQCSKVLGGQTGATFVDNRTNPRPLALIGERKSGRTHLIHGIVTTGPRKDEDDRWQQSLGVQYVHHGKPRWRAPRRSAGGARAAVLASVVSAVAIRFLEALTAHQCLEFGVEPRSGPRV